MATGRGLVFGLVLRVMRGFISGQILKPIAISTGGRHENGMKSLGTGAALV
jgi:hypothetical protein